MNVEHGFSKFLSVVRTSVLAGLGAGVITKEKAEQAVKKLVEQGKITAEESRKLVDELLESGSRQAEDMKENVDNALKKALESADIASAKKLKSVFDRLEKAEQRISMLEDALEEKSSSDNAD